MLVSFRGGFEFIFANGKVYVFGYIGAAAGQALNDILQWIKLSLLKAFSKKNPLASIEQFLSGSISVCLFAVFSSTVSYFVPEGYVGPFIGHCFTIPTVYGIAAKTFFTTYNTYTCIGVGVSYPPAWDNSLVYTHYMLLGTINLSATIRNFVDKKTKGLKA
ncbi:MAG: hypothetical protein IJZ44_09205 [Lachnospiraceae bacterium]|nr:hypothetical protein [Lachnospiraceae bacterium]